jgi:hypothetical protein
MQANRKEPTMTTTAQIANPAAARTTVIKPAARMLGVASGLSAVIVFLVVLAVQPAAQTAPAPVDTEAMPVAAPYGDTSVPAAINDNSMQPAEPVATF